jgi:hypothetical protein
MDGAMDKCSEVRFFLGYSLVEILVERISLIESLYRRSLGLNPGTGGLDLLPFALPFSLIFTRPTACIRKLESYNSVNVSTRLEEALQTSRHQIIIPTHPIDLLSIPLSTPLRFAIISTRFLTFDGITSLL